MDGANRATSGVATAAGVAASTELVVVIACVAAVGVAFVAALVELVASDGLLALGSGGDAVAAGALDAEPEIELPAGGDVIGGHGLITTVTGETAGDV